MNIKEIKERVESLRAYIGRVMDDYTNGIDYLYNMKEAMADIIGDCSELFDDMWFNDYKIITEG
jgi:hypothetical protein